MLAGQRIPFGQAMPDRLHAVSVSMPTLENIVEYEEKRPNAQARMRSGYPRFLAHPCLKAIESYWQELFGKPGQPIWLTTSETMAKRLQERLNHAETKFIRHRGVCGLRLPAVAELDREAKLFLQHVGGLLSSRQAEDYLVAEGLKGGAEPEALFEGDARARVTGRLRALLCAPDEQSLALAPSGMNAAYAAVQGVNSLQVPKGRRSWIKLGWLYADTMHILDKFSPPGARNEDLFDATAMDRLEALLKERGEEFAGIITEAPTNPLIQTLDLDRLRRLARQHGVYTIVDPTVQSPFNVDVSPFADLIVVSLTKYFAHEGDVMLGAVSATADCPERAALMEQVRRFAEPVYPRDLARLAAEMESSDEFVAKSNANAAAVLALLENHPKVRRVYGSKQGANAERYAAIARAPEAIGSLLSFEYNGPLAEFYDRLALPKGPSFGTDFTLVCPFLYLAHYDLVSTPEGRATLAAAGISPELLRLSVGCEPVEDLIAALEEALG